jgi:hypothetical protein
MDADRGPISAPSLSFVGERAATVLGKIRVGSDDQLTGERLVSTKNVVRQALLSRLPRHAIDKVTFRSNTSNMHDEALALRLGLLPVVVEDGSEEVSIRLDVSGPCTVRARHLILPFGISIAAGFEDSILCHLVHPRQRVALEAWIRIGTGVEHAKFSSIAKVAFDPLDDRVVMYWTDGSRDASFVFEQLLAIADSIDWSRANTTYRLPFTDVSERVESTC